MMKIFCLIAVASTTSAFAPQRLLQQRSHLIACQANMHSDGDRMCIVNAAEHYMASEQEDGNDAFDSEQEHALMNALESEAYFLEARLEEMRSLVFDLSDYPQMVPVDHYHDAGPVLHEVDAMGLLNTADFCAATSECSIDDREALVNSLNEESTARSLRLSEILSVMKRLQVTSRHHDHNPEEMDSLMHSIQSVVSMEYENTYDKVPTGEF